MNTKRGRAHAFPFLMIKTTGNNLFHYCIATLSSFDDGEKKALVYILLEDAYGVSKTDILLNKSLSIDVEKLDTQLQQLNNNVPIQHLVGFAIFRNRKFSVSPDVLIPRPETEEIIDIIKDFGLDRPEIIDIGTGSGCIAISLDLEINNASVKAIDISEKVLAVAQKNAEAHNSKVQFLLEDFLNYSSAVKGKYDLIISNPPYIKQSEAAEMDDNVLKHEPHIALFVENEDPLIFYRHIAAFGHENLKKAGAIVVEINANLGIETKKLFQASGYSDVKLISDFYDKDRFVVAKR